MVGIAVLCVFGGFLVGYSFFIIFICRKACCGKRRNDEHEQDLVMTQLSSGGASPCALPENGNSLGACNPYPGASDISPGAHDHPPQETNDTSVGSCNTSTSLARENDASPSPSNNNYLFGANDASQMTIPVISIEVHDTSSSTNCHFEPNNSPFTEIKADPPTTSNIPLEPGDSFTPGVFDTSHRTNGISAGTFDTSSDTCDIVFSGTYHTDPSGTYDTSSLGATHPAPGDTEASSPETNHTAPGRYDPASTKITDTLPEAYDTSYLASDVASPVEAYDRYGPTDTSPEAYFLSGTSYISPSDANCVTLEAYDTPMSDLNETHALNHNFTPEVNDSSTEEHDTYLPQLRTIDTVPLDTHDTFHEAKSYPSGVNDNPQGEYATSPGIFDSNLSGENNIPSPEAFFLQGPHDIVYPGAYGTLITKNDTFPFETENPFLAGTFDTSEANDAYSEA